MLAESFWVVHIGELVDVFPIGVHGSILRNVIGGEYGESIYIKKVIFLVFGFYNKVDRGRSAGREEGALGEGREHWERKGVLEGGREHWDYF